MKCNENRKSRFSGTQVPVDLQTTATFLAYACKISYEFGS